MPPFGLDAQRERGDIQQHDVLDLARQHARLNRRADGDHLVGVDALMRLLARDLAHHLLHFGDARRATHQHHLVDIARLETSVLQRAEDGSLEPLEQVGAQVFELRAGERHIEVLGSARVCRDERQVDRGGRHGGEFDFGAFGGFFQALERLAVLAQVDAVLFLELVGEVIDDALVEVVAAKVRIARSGLHFEHAVADLQNRDIEGAAAKVEHEDGLVALLVQSVGERGGGRLVDDAQHLQPRDFTRVFGGGALRVVEVGGHSNHRRVHLFAQVGFGVRLEFLQHHRRDLFGAQGFVQRGDVYGCVALAVGDYLVGHARALFLHLVVASPDEAFDGENRVFGVHDGLALGRRAHQPLARLGEAHHRRAQATALRRRNHHRLAALQHGNHRVRRP